MKVSAFSYKVIDNVYTIVYTMYKEGDDFMQATIQKWGKIGRAHV